MNWIPFQQGLYDQQPLPPERRIVLVRTIVGRDSSVAAVAAGYMKFGAGCKDSPHFVIPSVGGYVEAWCDCLGDVDYRDVFGDSLVEKYDAHVRNRPAPRFVPALALDDRGWR